MSRRMVSTVTSRWSARSGPLQCERACKAVRSARRRSVVVATFSSFSPTRTVPVLIGSYGFLMPTDTTWNHELVDQMEWHWSQQARPRLDGLTDEEYLWEPVAGCWNIR